LNEIQVLPNEKTFGYGFSYASWIAGTVVTLANVPWNSDYRDLVHFDNQAGLDNYLDTLAGPTVTIGSMSYLPMNQPVRLNIPFERANTFNYLRAANPSQPITDPAGSTPVTYYYFVSAVNYVAPNTTELILQLDVWQTFIYSGVQFGNCYIEQGHVGIANQNQFSNFGRDYLTQPEGLDVGGEYQITAQWSKDIASALHHDNINPDYSFYSIMVVSTISLTADPGTVDAPKLASATGSQMENLPNGAEIYVFSTTQFKAFMAEYSQYPWVTQGIISITAIPGGNTPYGMPYELVTIGTTQALKVDAGSLVKISESMATSWRDTVDLGRYSNLKKFLTYPYSVLELTSYTGTPLLLKPESWADPDATVIEVPHFAPPSPRLAFYPYRYNAGAVAATTDANGVINDGGEFLDMATGIFDFPTFSLVNNGYLSYMAANRNGIAYQHSSADWAQQRALAGNQVSADQASGAINTSRGITGMGINAASQQTSLANETGTYRAMMSAGQSALGGVAGVAGGNPGAAVGALSGMAGAALGNAIDMNQRNQSLGISNTLARGVNDASTGQAGYVRDTNKGYADMAARGDYQNAIAGINAKVQDAKLIQPTTSGQVGGDAFLLATYKWGYDLKLKMLQPASMASIGEYWLRYGYKINRFGRMPDNFMVCEKFTYWKLRETYITASNCPETFKQALRGIFEKGVTVWKNPADIGNIDIADNAPLAGVAL
jgi:hypothetical protein